MNASQVEVNAGHVEKSASCPRQARRCGVACLAELALTCLKVRRSAWGGGRFEGQVVRWRCTRPFQQCLAPGGGLMHEALEPHRRAVSGERQGDPGSRVLVASRRRRPFPPLNLHRSCDAQLCSWENKNCTQKKTGTTRRYKKKPKVNSEVVYCSVGHGVSLARFTYRIGSRYSRVLMAQIYTKSSFTPFRGQWKAKDGIRPARPLLSHLRYASQEIQKPSQYLNSGTVVTGALKVFEGNTLT